MDERRKSTRTRSLRAGKILFNRKQSVISCTVRNFCDTGAKLEVQTALGIPAFFDLLIEGETASRACDLVWKADNRLGVSFQQASKIANARTEHATVTSPTQPTRALGVPVRGELLALRASLDEVQFGIVLLDADLRAQFINKAFRKMWRLPGAKADAKPAFVTLMYHGRDTRAYDIPEEKLDAYIRQRVAQVHAGDETPRDLRLANGEVIRFQCMKLPGGGRMLSYTYVTDIVRHSDELEALRAALDSMEQGIILLDAQLNSRFMNSAVRRLWQVSDEEADRRPAYADLVKDARKSGVYGVSTEALESFIARRISLVRAGDPRPMDVRVSDGRIVRSQCAALPGGGRMLTYTDVTDLVRRCEELGRLAVADELTGVNNRRHFQALVAAEWQRFLRYRRPLSLLVLDVDHFSSVNDRFGHAIGDQVLAHVGRLCKETKRASDIVGRTGGDEFAVLLPETDLTAAATVADRLCQIIAENLPPALAGKADLTVSIGVAAADIETPDAGELVKMAGRALHEAKAAGRNCVAHSQPEASPDAPASRSSERRPVH